MRDIDKTKEELIEEVGLLRKRVRELEQVSSESKKIERELLETKQSTEVTLKELKDTNLQLEQAIEKANQMAVIAETGNITKSQFLSNMNHEFRTPMNAILGMSNLLLDTSLTAEQREWVEVIISAGNSLFSLLSEILTLTEIQDGHFELDEISFKLRTFIDDIIKIFRTDAEKKNLGLFHYVREDIPETLEGDSRLLKTVIIRILENAIKFTDTGEIVLRIEPGKPEKDEKITLHFSISDTGIGIAEDKLDVIFDSFTQIDSSLSRKYEGIGIGLSIAQKLVTILGGKIWVESKLNHGSTFHFTVKLNSINL
ncbi:MAG: ATP-binding protein [Candidatus Eremiobacterota bacterium]